MTTDKQSHRFLEINAYHLSERLARKAAVEILRKAGGTPSQGQWDPVSLSIVFNGVESNWTFRQIVAELRRTGVLERQHELSDRADVFFGGGLFMATTGSSIQLAVNHHGKTSDLRGPCRIAPIEPELMKDILFFRREACLASYESHFETTVRYFRAYVVTSISLLEAFLNKHILVSEAKNCRLAEMQEMRGLRRLEDKILKWIEVFTTGDVKRVTTAACWSHFRNLQEARNSMLHVTDAYSASQIEHIANALNDVKKGIGELLAELRAMQGLPSLVFIERLRTAPIVSFRPRTAKEESLQ